MLDELIRELQDAGLEPSKRDCHCNHGRIFETGEPCSDCEAGRRVRAEKFLTDEARESEKEYKLEKEFAKVIPARFLDFDYESFLETDELSSIMQWAHYVDGNLFLYGPNGTGKTTLAFAAIKELIRHGYKCSYWQFDNLLFEIRNSYSSGEDISSIFRDCKETGVLFLDDLGSADTFKSGSSHTLDVLTTILDYRYAHKKPVIVTSNLTKEHIRELYGNKIADRLFHDCEEVNVDLSRFNGGAV